MSQGHSDKVSCSENKFLEAFVDNELSPERTLELEAHVETCSFCRDEAMVLREIKSTLGEAADVALPPEFSARLCARLSEECRREDEHARVSTLPHAAAKADFPASKYRPLNWKTIVPLAAAAVAVLSIGASQKHVQDSRAAEATTRAGVGQESLVDLLVAHHTRGDSPELVNQQDIRVLEPEVGIPIHPPDLNRYGARFVGASRLSVAHARAASLHYNLNGRRVTLYVYDPEDMPLRTLPVLHPTVVGKSAVFVGHRRGYSIATCEKGGVGYAVAADMSDEESAELVAAVDR